MTTLRDREKIQLMDAIIAMKDCVSESDFRSALDHHVLKIIPHEVAACGVGDISTMNVIALSNLEYPLGFLKMIIEEDKVNSEGRKTIKSPVLDTWLQQDTVISIDDSHSYNRDYQAWTEASYQFGMNNFLVTGNKDLSGRYFTYISLGNRLAPVDDVMKLKMDLMSPFLHHTLAKVLCPYDKNKLPLEISEREEEILQGLAKGYANKRIATLLGISSNTVRNHLHNIARKLGVDNRVQILSKALETGILKPKPGILPEQDY